MSLFQVREWWGIRCGTDEEFDQDHLIVDNIDNDPNNVDKIITASLEGTIRIYLPTQPQYKVEHLILETDLKQSILQIAFGRFLSNDKSKYLAVLHSRQLCVYSVTAVGGYGTKAQYYQLNKKYHHNLDRNAFNMIYGPFGQRPHGANPYRDVEIYSDSICVQSIDGKFWVFEQENFSFSRDWNNFLIPGCIVYAPYNDAFVTMTGDMQVYSYSYAVLSTSEQQKLKNLALSNRDELKQDGDNHIRKTTKSFHKNWSLNLCDHAIKMICCRFTQTISPTDHDIVILCQRGIFAISTNGVIKWQTKLEYNPSTMFAYKARQTDVGWMDNLIIGNFQNNISIYSQCQLVWSARLQFNPIDINIGTFDKCQGMQILLSDDGHLMIGYLGTDPSGYKPIHVENREPDWQQIENDMKQSKEEIRALEDNEIPDPIDYLILDLKHAQDDDDNADKIEWIDDGGFLNEQYGNQLVSDSMGRLKAFKIILIIKYQGRSQYGLSNIQITIDNDETFICNQNEDGVIDIEDMNSLKTEKQLELIFYAKKTRIPHTRDVNIYVSYENEDEKLQSNTVSVELPLNLLLYTSTPIKNTKYIFTLEVNGMNPPLPTDLFNDLIERQNQNDILRTPQALTMISYFNNYDVTLLLSRKGGRIRIQSGELTAIWMVIDELVSRLYEIAVKKDAILIRLRDELPLNIYLESIISRYSILCEMRNYEKNLEKLSNQFRVIEKRLLTRYRNKNPTPLNEMDVLMKKTYENIINDTNKLEILNCKYIKISDKLCNLTHLLWLLMKLKYKLDNINFKLLKAYLPICNDEIEEGWEEQIEASMVYVLRTCLAKSKKDRKISQHKIGKIKDINKVVRHIKIVCDRLDKGHRFTDNPVFD